MTMLPKGRPELTAVEAHAIQQLILTHTDRNISWAALIKKLDFFLEDDGDIHPNFDLSFSFPPGRIRSALLNEEQELRDRLIGGIHPLIVGKELSVSIRRGHNNG